MIKSSSVAQRKNKISSKGVKRQNTPARGAAVMLLRLLANTSAYATASAIGDASVLDVFSARNGISLRTGAGSAESAKELVSEGLAAWQRGKTSGRQRLEITQAGYSRLARLDAGDEVEPFFAQHAETSPREVEVSGVTRSVVIDDSESPLAWLAKRKNAKGQALLDPTLLEAGERLRRDLTFAQMVPRVTANWDPGSGGGSHSAPLTYSEVVIAARQRADLALRAAGPEFAGLLMDVCGFLKGLELIETERRWPRRSAKLVLELALSALARHYGLETRAVGPARSRGVQHWGSEDYRPSIAS